MNMSDAITIDEKNDLEDLEEDSYESTPEEETGFEGASAGGFFNRKRVMIALCIVFAVVICGGLLVNIANNKSKKAAANDAGARVARGVPSDFKEQRDNASLRDGGTYLASVDQPAYVTGEAVTNGVEPLPTATVADRRNVPPPPASRTPEAQPARAAGSRTPSSDPVRQTPETTEVPSVVPDTVSPPVLRPAGARITPSRDYAVLTFHEPVMPEAKPDAPLPLPPPVAGARSSSGEPAAAPEAVTETTVIPEAKPGVPPTVAGARNTSVPATATEAVPAIIPVMFTEDIPQIAAVIPAVYRSPMVPFNVAGIIFGDTSGNNSAFPSLNAGREAVAGSIPLAQMYPYRASNAAEVAQQYLEQAMANTPSQLLNQAQTAQSPGAMNFQTPQTPLPGQNVQFNPLQTAQTPAPAAQGMESARMPSYGAADNRSVQGTFLGDNSLWIGTIIPGILITSINTDLPGNVLARVTQNVYDSKTGKQLLIPQGSILSAQYNNSVSYAQSRVQIVWDTLIRPDGYQINLDNQNGVDNKGMSGQGAKYHENWFEYVKAAGLINVFSVANAKMTESAAKYATDETAASMAQANSEFVNEMGSNFVGRAMNIQPTLTIDSGTSINIMLNKTLYLSPVDDHSVAGKYILR
jgi:type IV secretory pathway VirB10-like protein